MGRQPRAGSRSTMGEAPQPLLAPGRRWGDAPSALAPANGRWGDAPLPLPPATGVGEARRRPLDLGWRFRGAAAVGSMEKGRRELERGRRALAVAEEQSSRWSGEPPRQGLDKVAASSCRLDSSASGARGVTSGTAAAWSQLGGREWKG